MRFSALIALLAAAIEPGHLLPRFEAQDVTGKPVQSAALLQEPSLVVVMTDRSAADGMQAWFDAASARGVTVHRLSIISLSLPFFVSTGYARDRARNKVPERFWHATLFDRDTRMAGLLGLGDSDEPFVFATGAGGRVLARFHGPPGAPGADRIWASLVK